MRRYFAANWMVKHSLKSERRAGVEQFLEESGSEQKSNQRLGRGVDGVKQGDRSEGAVDWMVSRLSSGSKRMANPTPSTHWLIARRGGDDHILGGHERDYIE